MIEMITNFVIYIIFHFVVLLAIILILVVFLGNLLHGESDDNENRWRNTGNGNHYYGREGEEQYHDMMNDD